jgi:hypothetical protein
MIAPAALAKIGVCSDSLYRRFSFHPWCSSDLPLALSSLRKPTDEIVSSAYVEARNDFFASKAIFLALSRDAEGNVIDDWTLPLLAEFRTRGIQLFAYLTRTAIAGAHTVPTAVLHNAHVNVKLLSSFEDVAPSILADVEHLFLTER